MTFFVRQDTYLLIVFAAEWDDCQVPQARSRPNIVRAGPERSAGPRISGDSSGRRGRRRGTLGPTKAVVVGSRIANLLPARRFYPVIRGEYIIVPQPCCCFVLMN